MIVFLSAANGAACGKVRLDAPGDPVDAQVLTGDASPGQPDARQPASDAQTAPDARDAALPADAGPPCVDGDSQRTDLATGACYMLFTTTQLGWIAARNACEDLDPPAHLVTLTSADENTLAAEMAGMTNAWMGAHDLVDQGAEEGEFEWITGEPMEFTAWAEGEPNNGGPDGADEDCVILTVTDPSRPDSWDDRRCGTTQAYLCERE